MNDEFGDSSPNRLSGPVSTSVLTPGYDAGTCHHATRVENRTGGNGKCTHIPHPRQTRGLPGIRSVDGRHNTSASADVKSIAVSRVDCQGEDSLAVVVQTVVDSSPEISTVRRLEDTSLFCTGIGNGRI